MNPHERRNYCSVVVLNRFSFIWVFLINWQLNVISMAVRWHLFFSFISVCSRGVSCCTCSAWRVDVESSALDIDVGSELRGQWLVWGLRDLVGQCVDALDFACVWQEVDADALLSQCRQNFLHSVLQLCKNTPQHTGFQLYTIWGVPCCAMLHMSACIMLPHIPPGYEHMVQAGQLKCIHFSVVRLAPKWECGEIFRVQCCLTRTISPELNVDWLRPWGEKMNKTFVPDIICWETAVTH